MARPQAMVDKIWNRHAIVEEEGESLLYVDRALIHEGSIHTFSMLGKDGRSVYRPNQVFAFSDHYVPSIGREKGIDGIADPEIRAMVTLLATNTSRHGIKLFGFSDPQQGILHVVPPEQGITQPGLVLVGADSHTSTHGAFGCLAFGIGASEMMHAIATQSLWQRKSKTMRIVVEGGLPHGVTAKDVILTIISKIGIGGAAGHTIEYCGSTIRSMTMESRMTVCNMSIEAGAKAGLVAPDDITFAYMHERPYAPKGRHWNDALDSWKSLPSDDGARFDKHTEFDAANMAPMVTWGTNPEQALPITGEIPDPRDAPNETKHAEMVAALEYMGLKERIPMQDIRIDRVFIGSCTNSRIEDLRAAAQIAQLGRAKVPAWVVPGSQRIKREAEKEGLDRVFTAAGFEWRDAGCSLCTALNGDQLRPGERCASTSNRNFRGRQGRGGRTHLMSPAMAAAAALTGHLTDVRTLI